MYMFDVKKMGEQLAHLRTGNKYTQEQLAEALDVSPQEVSKWENAKSIPEIPVLCAMSKLFNCSIDTILVPESCVLSKLDFNYEFLLKPRVPVADYSGPEWPKNLHYPILYTKGIGKCAKIKLIKSGFGWALFYVFLW